METWVVFYTILTAPNIFYFLDQVQT